ncbi:MAG: DUF6231 family protein [Gammaproteobacteria bacterium]
MIFKHPDHLQFLIDKINDEDVSSINIITSRNVSPLIEKIEALDIKTINIYPSVNQDLIEPSDIFAVFDDIDLLDSDIGIIKNILSQKIILFSNNKDIDESMRKLGFDKEFFDIKRGLKCFSYNLKTYNNKRTWNNAEGWANPENFNKYRW